MGQVWTSCSKGQVSVRGMPDEEDQLTTAPTPWAGLKPGHPGDKQGTSGYSRGRKRGGWFAGDTKDCCADTRFRGHRTGGQRFSEGTGRGKELYWLHYESQNSLKRSTPWGQVTQVETNSNSEQLTRRKTVTFIHAGEKISSPREAP